jgi:hypothetical protein
MRDDAVGLVARIMSAGLHFVCSASFGEVGTPSPSKAVVPGTVLEKRYDLLARGDSCDREHRC